MYFCCFNLRGECYSDCEWSQPVSSADWCVKSRATFLQGCSGSMSAGSTSWDLTCSTHSWKETWRCVYAWMCWVDGGWRWRGEYTWQLTGFCKNVLWQTGYAWTTNQTTWQKVHVYIYLSEFHSSLSDIYSNLAEYYSELSVFCFNLSVFHTNLSALHTNLSAFQYGCMHAFFPQWTNNIRTVNKYCVCVSLFPFSCYNIEYSPRCQGTQPGILSEHWHPLLERNWGKSHLQHHTLCSYT